MTAAVAHRSLAGNAPSTRHVDEVAGLAAILAKTTNIVTLPREPSEALVDEARRAVNDLLVARQLIVNADNAEELLRHELQDFPHLAADVQGWVGVLLELTGCDSVRASLACLTETKCPRFHVDYLTLRLVMTYQGLGTEYVSNDDVDRRYLGQVAADHSDGPLLAPGSVRVARPFELVAMKGEAWPGNEDGGAVHRSPQASACSPRLVMTLDALSA